MSGSVNLVYICHQKQGKGGYISGASWPALKLEKVTKFVRKKRQNISALDLLWNQMQKCLISTCNFPQWFTFLRQKESIFFFKLICFVTILHSQTKQLLNLHPLCHDVVYLFPARLHNKTQQRRVRLGLQHLILMRKQGYMKYKQCTPFLKHLGQNVLNATRHR